MRQAELRTLEMRSVQPPPNGLLHAASDDNDQLAARCGLANGGAKKKVRLTVTADPRMPPILGAALLPNTRRATWEADFDQALEQVGAPAVWSADNFPTNALIMGPKMPNTTLTLDLSHLQKRTTGTFRSCARVPLCPPGTLHLARPGHSHPGARSLAGSRPSTARRSLPSRGCSCVCDPGGRRWATRAPSPRRRTR